MKTNQTYLENVVSLLVEKEQKIKDLMLYIKDLEKAYKDLALKYNDIVQKYYTKEKRTIIGYKKGNYNEPPEPKK